MDIFELSKLIGQEDNNNEAVVKYLQDHGFYGQMSRVSHVADRILKLRKRDR